MYPLCKATLRSPRRWPPTHFQVPAKDILGLLSTKGWHQFDVETPSPGWLSCSWVTARDRVWGAGLLCCGLGILLIFRRLWAASALTGKNHALFLLFSQNLQTHHSEVMKPLIFGHKSPDRGLPPPPAQHDGALEGVRIPAKKEGPV